MTAGRIKLCLSLYKVKISGRLDQVPMFYIFVLSCKKTLCGKLWQILCRECSSQEAFCFLVVAISQYLTPAVAAPPEITSFHFSDTAFLWNLVPSADFCDLKWICWGGLEWFRVYSSVNQGIIGLDLERPFHHRSGFHRNQCNFETFHVFFLNLNSSGKVGRVFKCQRLRSVKLK